MSILHPSAASRRVPSRRLIQIASLGLAGLLAGLFAGCSSSTASLITPRNDTDWITSSNYASATASYGLAGSTREPHLRPCAVGPCEIRVSGSSSHASHHPSM
jgi:hypothetical protein